MWRKRSCVSWAAPSQLNLPRLVSDIVACFRRTWEIKAINICTMSDVHTVRCPLSTLSRCPRSVVHCPLALLPSAGRCACVARVLTKRAHKSHCAWHLSKKLSVYGFGSPRSIRCLHLCYGLRSLVRLKVHSASSLLVLHATLRRLVSASSVLNVFPKLVLILIAL